MWALSQPSNARDSTLMNEPLMMSFEAELTELFTQLCFDPLHSALVTKQSHCRTLPLFGRLFDGLGVSLSSSTLIGFALLVRHLKLYIIVLMED